MIMMDKIKHFAVACLLTVGAALLLDSIAWAIAVAFFLSIAKEVYDRIKVNPTGFNLWDLLADALGIAAGIAIYIMIK